MEELYCTLNAKETLVGTINYGNRGPAGPKGDKGDKGDPGAPGSQVSVSASGTSTNEVSYITIDGVESKLAGSGGSDIFIAIVGTTTYNEVNDAYIHNKLVIAKDRFSNLFYCVGKNLDVELFQFSLFSSGLSYSYYNLQRYNGWSNIVSHEVQSALTAGNGISLGIGYTPVISVPAIPEQTPTEEGNYKLRCTVDAQGNPTYSWVLDQ